MEGDYLGLGFGPYDLDAIGIYLAKTPDAPYVFRQRAYPVNGIFTKNLALKGYEFSHVLQQERCTLSGLWEHCMPTYTDWSIGLYMTTSAQFKADLTELEEERYFGGKPGKCVELGIEGENTEYCIVPVSAGKTLMVIREYIDAGFLQVPGATPLATSDAMYARIRSAITFDERWWSTQ